MERIENDHIKQLMKLASGYLSQYLEFIFWLSKNIESKLIHVKAIFRVSKPACTPQHKVEPGERQLRNLL
jgi:hypothetical protein